MKKAALCMLLAMVMTLSLTTGAFAEADALGELSEADRKALDYLGSQLQEPAEILMRDGEDVEDLYSELLWTSSGDAFPEKFDLRDRGVVTSVKDQSPWGTCWSFATMGASEASILSSMGLTAEEYAEKYGYKFKALEDAPIHEQNALNGDANFDGKVTVRDCAYIAGCLASGTAHVLTDSADFNCDGKVNVRDAAAIAKFLAEIHK